MNVLEIIRFALRGLTINRLRTFLTTLGIMIGVSSVIILTAVGNGSSKAVQQSLDRLGTNSIQVRPSRLRQTPLRDAGEYLAQERVESLENSVHSQ